MVDNDAYKEICHYTSLEGLISILEKKVIWATSFFDLNDSKELKYSKDVLSAPLRKIFIDMWDQYQKNNSNLLKTKENDSEKLFQNLLNIVHDPLLNPESISEIGTHFLFCTTEHKDDDGLLSQWRAYGREGNGVGMVIKVENLNRINDNNLIWEGKVEYLSSVSVDFQAQLKEIEDGFKLYSEKYLENKLNSEPMQSIPHEKTKKFIEALVNFAYRFKHPGFHEEKEHRFVFLHRDLSDVKVRLKNNKLISFVEVFRFFDENIIEKIIVGPGPNQNRIRDNLCVLLKNNNIPIVLSKIPFVWTGS